MHLDTENHDQNLQTRDGKAERKLSHSFLNKDTHQVKAEVRMQQPHELSGDQTCAGQELLLQH